MIYTYPYTKLEEIHDKHYMKTSRPLKMDEIRKAVLQDEIDLLSSRIEPAGTGNLHTTIGTLKHRLEELDA